MPLVDSKPVMPEAYDYHDPDQLSPLAKSLGAGFVSPFGLSEHAMRLGAGYFPSQEIRLRHWADRLNELRSDNPTIAGIGSGISALVLANSIGRGLGALSPAYGGFTLRELLQAAPNAASVGGAIGNLGELLMPTKKPPRPQAAYPPGGAF